MADLVVYRLSFDTPQEVGRISSDGSSFAYSEAYLQDPCAASLSISLPLRSEAYAADQFRPYFEGLLAEGVQRSLLAAELQLPEDDYLALLAACGRECIGDVVFSLEGDDAAPETAGYDPVSESELRTMFLSAAPAAENAASRMSLAGTQGKVGLAHAPGGPISDDWLRPRGWAASTHILKSSHLRDVPEVEFLCMKAARACGISIADVGLVPAGVPVIAVERFDRAATTEGDELRVRRMHQEDLAQAFGVLPGSKYAELPGGSIARISAFLKNGSAKPAFDLANFARTIAFSYVAGNCDAHLKNFSIVAVPGEGRGERAFALAPAYDLVSTTYFPRFSRELAMSIGETRDIDAVDPNSFVRLASDFGMSAAALRRLVQPIVDHALEALRDAGEGRYGEVLASTPHIADDLMEDIAPRLEVLRAFCEGAGR